MKSGEAVFIVTLYASAHLDTTDAAVLHGIEGINKYKGKTSDRLTNFQRLFGIVSAPSIGSM